MVYTGAFGAKVCEDSGDVHFRYGRVGACLDAVRSQGDELKLVNVSLPVNEVLRITRLATLFDTAQNEATGAVSFRTSA